MMENAERAGGRGENLLSAELAETAESKKPKQKNLRVLRELCT